MIFQFHIEIDQYFITAPPTPGDRSDLNVTFGNEMQWG